MDDKDFEKNPGVHIGHVCVRYRRSIVLLSGYKGYNQNFSANFRPSSEIYVFDELSETWSVLKTTGENGKEDVPKERSGACGTVIGTHLYLFGGYAENGNSNSLYRLDFTTLKWRLMKPSGIQPLECDKTSCFEYDGRMYIFAGYGPSPSIARNGAPDERRCDFILDHGSPWHYTRGWNNQLVCYDPQTNSWQWPKASGQIPPCRAAHVIVRAGDTAFLFGGRKETDRMNDLYALDMVTFEWRCLMDNDPNFVVKGRSWHTLTAFSENELVLFGGFSTYNTPLKDCWKYIIDRNEWVEMNLGLFPRLWHSAILSSSGEVILCGGAVNNITFKVTDVEGDFIFPTTISTIRLQPRSLFRLCLEALTTPEEDANRIAVSLDQLPHDLHGVLKRRLLSNNRRL